jgi:hypothetical protein
MHIPTRTMWNGLALIVNPTVPKGGYFVTDINNDILAGGNIDNGRSFKVREGDAARIYVTEAVAKELLMNPKGGNDGAGNPH